MESIEERREWCKRTGGFRLGYAWPICYLGSCVAQVVDRYYCAASSLFWASFSFLATSFSLSSFLFYCWISPPPPPPPPPSEKKGTQREGRIKISRKEGALGSVTSQGSECGTGRDCERVYCSSAPPSHSHLYVCVCVLCVCVCC